MTRVLNPNLNTVLISAIFVAAFVAWASPARAQTPPLAYGHWEGALSSVAGEAEIQLDIGVDPSGRPAVTANFPSESITGLPLSQLKVDGQTVTFELPTKGEGSFIGAVSADGKFLTGTLEKPFGQGQFALTRLGDARFAPAPKSAAIGKQYEGAWAGMVNASGQQVAVRFVLANDGASSTGRMEIGEGRAGLPLALKDAGGVLTLDVVSAGESFAGKVDASGQLAGEYTTKSGAKVPLALKRS